MVLSHFMQPKSQHLAENALQNASGNIQKTNRFASPLLSIPSNNFRFVPIWTGGPDARPSSSLTQAGSGSCDPTLGYGLFRKYSILRASEHEQRFRGSRLNMFCSSWIRSRPAAENMLSCKKKRRIHAIVP